MADHELTRSPHGDHRHQAAREQLLKDENLIGGGGEDLAPIVARACIPDMPFFLVAGAQGSGERKND